MHLLVKAAQSRLCEVSRMALLSHIPQLRLQRAEQRVAMNCVR